jgi:hypothetical protein
MKTSFAEITKTPRGTPYPPQVNAIMRDAVKRRATTGTAQPEMIFRFRKGVCQSMQSIIQFGDAQKAFDTAEERHWFGDLRIGADNKVVFIHNTINDNVEFDNPKKGKNENIHHNS